MKRPGSRKWVAEMTAVLILCGAASAAFIDTFEVEAITLDSSGQNGWAFFTGSGTATIDFIQGDGFGSIQVDTRTDKRNVWWALIRRNVTGGLNLDQLQKDGYELRIEARIRTSHAPRRVNLHLNTQRTTDFHSHLMEYDIDRAHQWHTISMTTKDFDARPGDMVFGQLALMDWGRSQYQVDVDSFKVEVVHAATAGPDKGEPLPYHPPAGNPDAYTHLIRAVHDSTIDNTYPDMNFNNWHTTEDGKQTKLLAVSTSQIAILRWDLDAFAGKTIADWGMLELTAYDFQRGDDLKDFGQIRIVEILSGDADWDQKSVTYDSFCNGQSIDEVLNTQMIIDVDVSEGRGSQTRIPISRPVLQRLVDGRTKGLAIRPLGAISASFYAIEHGDLGARLYFNTKE